MASSDMGTTNSNPAFTNKIHSLADILYLNPHKSHHKFSSGQVIYYAGNPSTGVYGIQTGTVKLETVDNTGKCHIIQIASPGGLIGYRSLFSGEPALSSAIALQDTEAFFISKSTLLELFARDSQLALKFLSLISSEFHQVENRLQNATSHSATERIAEALLFLKENYSHQKWTRKEIADYAGTTTETVIRTLSSFEDQGWIQVKGRTIEILDKKALLNGLS